MMRLNRAGCAAMMATLLIGCGSKTPPAETAPSGGAPRTAVSVSAEDNAPPPPPVAAAENADPNAEAAQPTGPGDKVDPGLRAILVKFYNEQLHPAQSWDELLAGKYITKIPVGPDGKPLDWAKTMQEVGRAAVRGQ